MECLGKGRVGSFYFLSGYLDFFLSFDPVTILAIFFSTMYPLVRLLGGLDIFHCSESRKLLIPQKNSIGRIEMGSFIYPFLF